MQGTLRIRWSGLLIGAVHAGYMHRGVHIMLSILFLLTIFVGPRTTRTAPGVTGRSSLIRGILLLGALVVGALRIGPFLRSAFEMILEELPDLKASIL